MNYAKQKVGYVEGVYNPLNKTHEVSREQKTWGHAK